MTWIKTIPYKEATGVLLKLYNRVKGPDNNIDNILKSHSLRPHTLTGHMALYKNVLHNTNNTLPKWFLETIGTLVSHINQCPYCVEHHFSGLTRLLDNEERSDQILKGIQTNSLNDVLSEKYASAIPYIEKLTKTPGSISKEDYNQLGVLFNDGEILEINQVVSYFCYANRTVLGLGVNTEGDILGLSPNESADPDNWNHK
jgi:uncharacterized peroxidase-related enzyme